MFEIQNIPYAAVFQIVQENAKAVTMCQQYQKHKYFYIDRIFKYLRRQEPKSSPSPHHYGEKGEEEEQKKKNLK